MKSYTGTQVIPSLIGQKVQKLESEYHQIHKQLLHYCYQTSQTKCVVPIYLNVALALSFNVYFLILLYYILHYGYFSCCTTWTCLMGFDGTHVW